MAEECTLGAMGNPAWVKGGVSPNPTGRPAVPQAVRDALKAALPGAVDKVIALAQGKCESLFDAVNQRWALDRILSFGLGKPDDAPIIEQPVEVTGKRTAA